MGERADVAELDGSTSESRAALPRVHLQPMWSSGVRRVTTYTYPLFSRGVHANPPDPRPPDFLPYLQALREGPESPFGPSAPFPWPRPRTLEAPLAGSLPGLAGHPAHSAGALRGRRSKPHRVIWGV